MAVAPEIQRARRDLDNLRGFIRRAGLTGWVKDRSARMPYQRAFESVLRAEDALGLEACAGVSDRLQALYQEARGAGLLTIEEVCAAERAALEAVDREVSR